MPPPWRIRRQTSAHPEGQRRWDQAYQGLVRWATDPPIGPDDLTPPPPEGAARGLAAGTPVAHGRGRDPAANRPPRDDLERNCYVSTERGPS